MRFKVRDIIYIVTENGRYFGNITGIKLCHPQYKVLWESGHTDYVDVDEADTTFKSIGGEE